MTSRPRYSNWNGKWSVAYEEPFRRELQQRVEVLKRRSEAAERRRQVLDDLATRLRQEQSERNRLVRQRVSDGLMNAFIDADRKRVRDIAEQSGWRPVESISTGQDLFHRKPYHVGVLWDRVRSQGKVGFRIQSGATVEYAESLSGVIRWLTDPDAAPDNAVPDNAVPDDATTVAPPYRREMEF